MFWRDASSSQTRSMTLTRRAFLLIGAVAAVGCAQVQPMAESEDVRPRSGLAPCSQRLKLVQAAKLDGALTSSRALEFAFNAKRMTGVDENIKLRKPPGRESAILRVHYPKGSVNFGSARNGRPLGGASFYSEYAESQALCLGYSIRFPADFAFVKGGKLPGLFGGSAPSGGTEVTGQNGWSVRLMWRSEGAGELYEYIVNKEPEFGLSVGRGRFSFPRGRWVDIELEVVLNTPGNANGVTRLWVDGQPVIEQNDIVFRTDDSKTSAGMMFSTFFGGSDRSWATPKDQYVDFANFRMYAGEPQ